MPTCSPNICPVSPCCVSAAACTIIYSPSWVFLKYLRDSCTSQNTTKIKGKWVAFGAGPRMDQEEQMWHRGFWGKRQHMTNKSLTHWNPKWLYRREEISDFLDSLLLYFAACWARHRLSLLAKMWTSLMSPTQCQNWKLFRINLMLKGQNLRDQASITECMFTHILFFDFFFFFEGGIDTSTDIFLVMGLVFPFLICKMIVLACKKQLNAYLAGLFIWIQYRANICVLGEKK